MDERSSPTTAVGLVMLILCANWEWECILTQQLEINLASANNHHIRFAVFLFFFFVCTASEIFCDCRLSTSSDSLIDLSSPESLDGKHIDPWLLLVALITDGSVSLSGSYLMQGCVVV